MSDKILKKSFHLDENILQNINEDLKDELTDREIEVEVKEGDEFKEGVRDRKQEDQLSDKKNSFRKTKQRQTKLLKKSETNEAEEKKHIFKDIIIGSSISIVTSVCIILVETINLIFAGQLDPTLKDLKTVEMAFVLIYTFGKDFASGGISSFKEIGIKAFINKDYDLLYKIYNESKIFLILSFILIILPLNFPADVILEYIGIESELASSTCSLIRMILIPTLLNQLSRVHIAFLEIVGLDYMSMLASIFYLVTHLLLLTAFVYTWQMGVYGIGCAIIISEIVFFCCTYYFISLNNPCGKDLLSVDTESVSSSKFYLYLKESYEIGLLYSLRHMPFTMACFCSYYINSDSFVTNIIFLNYISLVYELITGFSNFSQTYMILNVKHKLKKILYSFKVTIISVTIITVIVSMLNYLLRNYISRIYIVDSPTINSYVSYLITLYSLFIFFDYGFNVSKNMVKTISKYSSLSVYFSIMSLAIFFPLGLVFSFSLHMSYYGFWYSIFISMVLFTAINAMFIRTVDIESEIRSTIKQLAHILDEEAVN
jgi:Na+-driven multidrug efflux pump